MSQAYGLRQGLGKREWGCTVPDLCPVCKGQPQSETRCCLLSWEPALEQDPFTLCVSSPRGSARRFSHEDRNAGLFEGSGRLFLTWPRHFAWPHRWVLSPVTPLAGCCLMNPPNCFSPLLLPCWERGTRGVSPVFKPGPCGG